MHYTESPLKRWEKVRKIKPLHLSFIRGHLIFICSSLLVSLFYKDVEPFVLHT